MSARAPLAVACVQLDQRPGESRERRIARVRAAMPAHASADLVVLPELWATGYFGFDRYDAEAEPLDGPLVAALAALAREHAVHLLAGSVVERAPSGALHNTALLLAPDGDLALAYRKVHLFGHGSREAELLTPGDEIAVADTALGRVGLATCYDLRFPELFRRLAAAGAELVVVTAAWPAARRDHWSLFARARALENQCALVACNGAGEDHGTALAGASCVVGPGGELLAAAGEGFAVLRAQLALDEVHAARERFPAFADRRLEEALHA